MRHCLHVGPLASRRLRRIRFRNCGRRRGCLGASRLLARASAPNAPRMDQGECTMATATRPPRGPLCGSRPTMPHRRDNSHDDAVVNHGAPRRGELRAQHLPRGPGAGGVVNTRTFKIISPACRRRKIQFPDSDRGWSRLEVLVRLRLLGDALGHALRLHLYLRGGRP